MPAAIRTVGNVLLLELGRTCCCMRHSGVGEMNTNAEEGPADAEHVAQDATSNNVEDRERRGILIAPLCRKLCRDGMHFPEAFSGAKSVKLS